VRYSITGESFINNAQPLTANLANGHVALAHNGNLVNSKELREELKNQGAIFQGTNDTEVILHFISKHQSSDILECFKAALKRLEGAFSLLLMNGNKLIAVRDPHGFRPLVMGKRKQEDGTEAYVFASESCAFDLIGAKYVREIKPGEMFWVDDEGEHSVQYAEPEKDLARCVFEHVYFSRPDSIVFDQSVYNSRKKMGQALAKEHSIDADLVIPVPDSGVAAAIGYSNESGLPFEFGIIRNHYVGRTFIQPSQSIRSFGVKIKLNPQAAVLKDKKVIVVDDSLVRGTTSKKIIQMLRAAGAKEVHFCVASPPTKSPCYYGVDTQGKSQLVAAHKTVNEIKDFINADTLNYLSPERMMASVTGKAQSPRSNGYCAACFTEDYPI